MAELLSMAMLSTEPVTTAKPQSAAQGSIELAEPDQSFAATLAAEVNGKTTDKSEKTTVKIRQNTATEAAKVNGSDHDNTQTPSKTEQTSDVVNEVAVLPDEEEATPATKQTVQEPAEQSHWLTLLDKAKSLHERLTKTAKSETEQQLSAKVSADKAATAESSSTDAATAVQHDMIDAQQAKATLTAGLALARQAENAAQAQSDAKGPIEVPEALATPSSKALPLSAEELKALKLVAQTLPQSAAVKDGKTEEVAADKVQVSTAGLSPLMTKQAAQQTKLQTEPQVAVQTKQQNAEQQIATDLAATLAESVETTPGPATPKTVQNPGELPVQTVVYSEKPLKVPTSLSQSVIPQKVDASDEQNPIPVQSLVQTEQVSSALKAAVPAATVKTSDPVVFEEQSDAEMPVVSSLEPKLTMQAQSAAALVAPAVQQAKPVTTEVKASTEDVLKQAQSAIVNGQSEQGGASSSSGESQHQAAAETLITAAEQQKSGPTVSAEAHSFSSQLKSTLEKTAAGITVAGRELVSEQSQKQVDQLGQKLNLIQPEASNQLKEKMLMMVKDKVHTAEIRLDPSELGSMQIKISLQQDQMSVQFMVQQGNAKDLMEQQMPKLKELLQQQGIELSQGSVQQQNQSSSGQEGGSRTAGGNGKGAAVDSSEELAGSAVLPSRNSDRVVDYYA